MKAISRTLAALIGLAVAGALHAQAPAAAPPAGAASPAPSATAASPAPAPSAPPPAAKAADNMEGLAAVYSDKLQGRKTANGEVFSQAKLTAAHPTIAFGSTVRVTNTKSGKTVDVKINDRGPKQAGRVIDLSSTAAAKIGIGKNAMAPVKLEVVAAAPAKKAT